MARLASAIVWTSLLVAVSGLRRYSSEAMSLTSGVRIRTVIKCGCAFCSRERLLFGAENENHSPMSGRIPTRYSGVLKQC
jgi:hypothetical protein